MSMLKNEYFPKSGNGFMKLLFFSFLMIVSGFVMAKRPGGGGGGSTVPTLTITNAVFFPEDDGSGKLEVQVSLNGLKGKPQNGRYTLYSDEHVQIGESSETKDKQFKFEITLAVSESVPCIVYATSSNAPLPSANASVTDCPASGDNTPPDLYH